MQIIILGAALVLLLLSSWSLWAWIGYTRARDEVTRWARGYDATEARRAVRRQRGRGR